MVHIWCETGLQYGEGRMMIDSVVLAQYINVTDKHTDSHVAITNAALRTGVGRQNPGFLTINQSIKFIFRQLSP